MHYSRIYNNFMNDIIVPIKIVKTNGIGETMLVDEFKPSLGWGEANLTGLELQYLVNHS